MANTTNVEARKIENDEIEYYTAMTFTESGERTETTEYDMEYTAVSELPLERDAKEATISISFDNNEPTKESGKEQEEVTGRGE